eukprot:7260239-Prymnesium_polylepis.1
MSPVCHSQIVSKPAPSSASSRRTLVGERLHLRVDERDLIVEGLLVHRCHIARRAEDVVLAVVVAGEKRRQDGAHDILRAAVRHSFRRRFFLRPPPPPPSSESSGSSSGSFRSRTRCSVSTLYVTAEVVGVAPFDAADLAATGRGCARSSRSSRCWRCPPSACAGRPRSRRLEAWPPPPCSASADAASHGRLACSPLLPS